MEIPKTQKSLLREFGASFGLDHATLSPNDLTHTVRRAVPAVLKENRISGNHEDRQALKDIATNAAHQAMLDGEQSVT